MSAAKAPNGTETEIRAIVFKENGAYVGQCLEYDIAAQASNIEALIDQLDLAVEAEFATCFAMGKKPHECIGPAPIYYHALWDAAEVKLMRVNVKTPVDGKTLTLALAKAA